MSLTAVAACIGRTKAETNHLLRTTGLHGRYGRLRLRKAITYDQRVIDVLHALTGQPHRPLGPAESDWLSAYLEENG